MKTDCGTLFRGSTIPEVHYYEDLYRKSNPTKLNTKPPSNPAFLIH